MEITDPSLKSVQRQSKRNARFVKDWNSGMEPADLARKYGLYNRKSALNLASLLRRLGHPIKKRAFTKIGAAKRLASWTLMKAQVPGVTLMDASGRVIGRMDPESRVRTMVGADACSRSK